MRTPMSRVRMCKKNPERSKQHLYSVGIQMTIGNWTSDSIWIYRKFIVSFVINVSAIHDQFFFSNIFIEHKKTRFYDTYELIHQIFFFFFYGIRLSKILLRKVFNFKIWLKFLKVFREYSLFFTNNINKLLLRRYYLSVNSLKFEKKKKDISE